MPQKSGPKFTHFMISFLGGCLGAGMPYMFLGELSPPRWLWNVTSELQVVLARSLKSSDCEASLNSSAKKEIHTTSIWAKCFWRLLYASANLDWLSGCWKLSFDFSLAVLTFPNDISYHYAKLLHVIPPRISFNFFCMCWKTSGAKPTGAASECACWHENSSCVGC